MIRSLLPFTICLISFAIMYSQRDYVHPNVIRDDQYDLQEVTQISEDLANLIMIKRALDRYRNDHNAYPISSGFDGIKTRWGDSRVDWIKGLTPKYITTLPVDTRNSDSDEAQYLYRSNGARYKLIAHLPKDCYEVKSKYPELIDPQRDCWSYGFWGGVDTENW